MLVQEWPSVLRTTKRLSVTAAVLLSIVAMTVTPAAASARGLIRTTQPLDEPRGYCLDIPGAGPSLRLDEPLQVHTCKYGDPLEDQQFERTEADAIRAMMYGRCLAASSLESGAQLLMRPCVSGPTQRWAMAWGRLSPASRTDLCVSLAAEPGQAAGTPILISPVYRRRDLRLERCDDAQEGRQAFRWGLETERGRSSAETARQGMPADVARQLAALFGRDDANQATYKIFEGVPRVYAANEITIAKNIPYGSHERQQIDIHTATLRRSDRPVPVVVVLHGGGLIGGSRANTATVADYFASIGYVGVNAGYRLAPEHKWPEGARDVGAVVTWLRDHVADHGGNPDQIFVAGVSTGALHAATYVFRPELMPPGTARPAGAILLSGPYTFDFNDPTKGELAYFGEDRSRWPQMVVPGNVTRSDVPVLFTTAEWDNERYPGPFADLYRELVEKHGARPRVRQSLGHTHVSQLLSVGTADTSVSREMLDFIARTLER